MPVRGCLQRPEEGIRSLETGVTGGCENWELNLAPLEEQQCLKPNNKQALLTIKTPLQPQDQSDQRDRRKTEKGRQGLPDSGKI